MDEWICISGSGMKVAAMKVPSHTCPSGLCVDVHAGGYLYLTMHVQTLLHVCRGISIKSSQC